ncbi:pyridoxal phosphate-dependent aminotransferase [Candidatus Nomurabacteria bacterium]|nr:pyridoxal phosphate-dependent aminotransferase [Candidatus Nomurabacteria bacterium]
MDSFIDYYEYISDNKTRIKSKLGYYYHFGKGDINRKVIGHKRAFFEPIVESCFQGNLGYCDPAGRKSTRELISRYEALNRNCVDLSYKNIALTLGATNAIYGALSGALVNNRSKKIIVFTPCYTYVEAIRSLGYEVKFIDICNTEEACIQLNRSENADCAAVFLANPIFPIGKQVDPLLITEIKKLSELNNFYLFIDEVYSDMWLNKQKVVNFYTKNTVIIRSFSKEFGIPGLRCGYVLGPEELINNIRRKNEYVFGTPIVLFEVLIDLIVFWKLCIVSGSVPTRNKFFGCDFGLEKKQLEIIKKIDLDGFFNTCESFTIELLATLRDGLIESNDILDSCNTLEFIEPDCGFNAVVKNKTSKTYKDIFNSTGVVLTPCELFNLPNHFRFTFGDSAESISKAWKRVVEYLEKTP